MDYTPDATHIAKWQWDLIHDPGVILRVFERDADAMRVSTSEVFSILDKLRTARINNTEAKIGITKNTLLVTGNIVHFNSYPYKSIAIKAGRDISMQSVNTIYEEEHYLGTEKYYDLVIGNLLITLRSDDDRRMMYKYLTNTGNAILFVNGYRFAYPEKADTDNTVTINDRHSYWEGINVSFTSRLKNSKPFYADGHMSIGTSNHLNIGNFYCSAHSAINNWPSSFTEFALKHVDNGVSVLTGNVWIPLLVDKICPANTGEQLNTTPNVSGFNRRREEGRKGGINFVTQLRQSSFSSSDTLDIVCHSMGFAYALGMIEEIKTQMPDIKLGGFYIIAPENGCSGKVNINDWQEVWQYGSDELKDAIYEQDGVAPQCPVNNIGENRAFIPNDAPKGFISSHSIGNYKWIFTTPQKKGDPGYVTPRK
jgi:hypothetical protein